MPVNTQTQQFYDGHTSWIYEEAFPRSFDPSQDGLGAFFFARFDVTPYAVILTFGHLSYIFEVQAQLRAAPLPTTGPPVDSSLNPSPMTVDLTLATRRSMNLS